MDAVDFYPGLPPGVKGVSKEFIYSIILSTFSDCFYFFTLMVLVLEEHQPEFSNQVVEM